MTVQDALRRFGAVATAVMLVRNLADQIDDTGVLHLDGEAADDVSFVALELEEIAQGRSRENAA